MDITPQDTTTQPISDDQELAKALAGVLPDEPEEPATDAALSDDMQFEEIPAPAAPASTPVADAPASVEPLTQSVDFSALETPAVEAPKMNADLESIKNEALNELRPLLDRVDIPVEEKFDTYLMLIRSTDDAELIGPAHTAAQAITDEKRKAEALLDIIKEIDYLSKKEK